MTRVVHALAQREVVRFLRQPQRLLGSLAQPLLIWVFLGSGFSPSFQHAGGATDMSYLEYFYPGMLLMQLLFASITSTITTIEDRNQGLLQGVLACPAPRMAIVLGKVAGSMTLALLQTIILLAALPFLGLHVTAASLLAILAAFVITALGFTALGFIIAWNMESTAGFHAIMSVFLMPLWMLSGALFPLDNVPAWLGILMALNPVTHALTLIREPFYTDAVTLLHQTHFLTALAVALLWAVGCLLIALKRVQRVEQGARIGT